MSLSKSTDSIVSADLERAWFIVDVDDAVLGRIATRIATVLRGKHKPSFTPHNDTGDFVIVINADKVKLTGRKLDQKLYRYHTGFSGGLKEKSARKVMASNSDRAIRAAVRGMLPKGPLGRQTLRKLKIYRGAEHPHAAQNPVPLEL